LASRNARSSARQRPDHSLIADAREELRLGENRIWRAHTNNEMPLGHDVPDGLEVNRIRAGRTLSSVSRQDYLERMFVRQSETR
jgi:hypothetical protein